MVPKMTCSPSKKLSPMMMTVAPPVVQPSLGLMALIQGAAASRNTTGPIWRKEKNKQKNFVLSNVTQQH